MLKKIKNLFSFEFEGKTRKEIRKEQLLALISGILIGLSFPPFPLFFLSFVALVPLFYVWENRNGLASINRITYIFGLGFTLVTLYWVGSWTKDADPFLMLSGTALIFFNPLLFLIPSTLFHFAKKNLHANKAFFLIPFFWVFYEYIYSLTDLRFPWIQLGHGLADFNSFIQVADVIGSMGLSSLVILANVCFYFVYKTGNPIKPKFATLGILVVVIPVIYGGIKLSTYEHSSKSVRVGIVQPDFNPWKKWDAGNLDQQLQIYLDLSKQTIDEGAKVLMWPETALPDYIRGSGFRMQRAKISAFLIEHDVSLISGMPDYFVYKNKEEAPADAKKFRNQDRYYTSYNSLWGLIPESEEIQAYQKMLLVPFGEFTPFAGSLPFLREFIQWGVGIGNWNIGQEIKLLEFPQRMTVNHNRPLKVGGVICIESIFQEFVSGFVEKGADFIAVVTNDSWYGNSSGPRQHKAIGILRAVENNRSVVRCANGGISCIISPTGKIQNETKMFTRATLTGNVIIEDKLTFFSKYPNLVPFISTIVTLFIIGISIINRKRNKVK